MSCLTGSTAKETQLFGPMNIGEPLASEKLEPYARHIRHEILTPRSEDDVCQVGQQIPDRIGVRAEGIDQGFLAEDLCREAVRGWEMGDGLDVGELPGENECIPD